MRFQEIIKVHNQAKADGSHSDILGDAYLLSVNPTYRRIRLAAANLGVVLEEATAKYLLMPFQQLDNIVASKVVPYIPHARLMAEVESKAVGHFALEQMPIPESYHMHESAHVIANISCAEIDATSKQDRIVKAILCESFANTTDAMACGFADSEVHRLILKLNCYMDPTEDVYDVMSSVREVHGEAYTARLVLISYIYANFLRAEVPAEMLGAGMGSEECQMLSTIGQQLDPVFREQTTQNYFNLRGIQGEAADLVNFDFYKQLQRKDFSQAFDALVDILSE